jgi:uncharacterized phage protein (TIGR01671 family)
MRGFRVYDKQEKRMIDNPAVEWIFLSGNGNLVKPANPALYLMDRYVRMDSIGSTDKNDKEIYEGDIVRVLGWAYIIKTTSEIVEYDLDSEMYMREDGTEIELSEDKVDFGLHRTSRLDIATMDRFPRFWLKEEEFGYEGEDLVDSRKTEVIGNIYDNPELLKESK